MAEAKKPTLATAENQSQAGAPGLQAGSMSNLSYDSHFRMRVPHDKPRAMKAIRIGLAAGSMLAVASCAGMVKEPTNAQLVENFLDTAYGYDSGLQLEQTQNTGARSGSANRRLYKVAQGKACISVLGKPDKGTQELVESVDAAYRIGGLLDVTVGSICADGANLLVVFIPIEAHHGGADQIYSFTLEEIRNRVGLKSIPGPFEGYYETAIRRRYLHPSRDMGWARRMCSVNPSFRHNDAIHTPITISNHFGYFTRCVYEEIFQALGLSYDTIKSWPSLTGIGSDGFKSDYSEKPSAYDLLNLRLLYDPSLSSSMSRIEARAVVSQLILKFRPDQTRPPRPETMGFSAQQ